MAKSLLKQFDTPAKCSNRGDDRGLSQIEDELDHLAVDLEAEEMATWIEGQVADGRDDDDVEGWIDEVAAMDESERERLKKNILPVRTVLVKVCNC